MNVYLVVEGRGEKRVYAHWVPLVNPSLSVVDGIDQVTNNNIFIISGEGYPHYFDVIENGVYDVANDNNFDRLVIAIDAEDMAYEEKRQEIIGFIEGLQTKIEYRVIVQNFCLETWALGNKKIFPRNPTTDCVRAYQAIYNVLENDPEQLPGWPEKELNRSQFSVKYLRCLFNEKYRNLAYTKSNPSVLLHHSYYKRVKERFETTDHIASFNDFLTAFA